MVLSGRLAVACDVPGEFACEDAFLMLAQRHLEGRGVRRDARAARKLLERAALRGGEVARQRLRRLEARGAGRVRR